MIGFPEGPSSLARICSRTYTDPPTVPSGEPRRVRPQGAVTCDSAGLGSRNDPKPLALAAGLAASALLASSIAAIPANATKPGSGSSEGTARIFKVNPVQATGDQTLTDDKDAASAVPESAYATVELRNLDGTGTLSGKWANVRTSTGTPAYSTTNAFLFNRDQDQFEQTMGYFWVNEAQEYLQTLGFGVVKELPAILKRPYDVRVGQYGLDNSYMWSKHDYIRLGKGGVDDAEDAEVIVHEYGHAIHHDQVDGFGEGVDAGAIGESFGDYFAVSVGLAAEDRYGWTTRAEEACPMDWDAVSYTGEPHCIRRFDTGMTVSTRTGRIHADGQIWSQALWEIRQGYVAKGMSTAAWDTSLILSQFEYAPDTSWQAAARETYLVAQARDGQVAADLVREKFALRGITFTA